MKRVNLEIGGKSFSIEESDRCKDTIIYKNVSGLLRKVGRGATLYEACIDYNDSRTCGDDLFKAFNRHALKNNISYDDDTFVVEFTKWFDELEGAEFFDIIRDGDYDCYIDWHLVPVEDEEE